MISRYTHKTLTWIDLENPTREEISALAEEYDLHPVAANELFSPSERAKIDLYENSLYLILHFPIHNKTTGHVNEVEVDFILLKDVLITTHYELVDPLHDFAKLFEVGSYLNHELHANHAGFLFYFAIRELYNHTLFLLEGVSHDIRDIEKHIFAGDESVMVAHISKTNRALIDVRQSMRYHKETLKSFSHACLKIYGADFAYYVSAIEGNYERIIQMAEENRQTLHDLRETNDSLLSSKSTSTIRRLTAVNVIMMPLSFITWVFSMNSTYLHLNNPTMLTTVFGVMAIIFLLSVLYFRNKKWL
jgi:magnesium transporter